MQLDEWIAALARRVAADLSREPPPDVLWQRFRDENDQYAAVVLIALHGRPVWNYCRSALADYQAAEEVFQDTFRDLYRRRHRIRHHAAVRGWLLQTAHNKVRDTWRRQGRRPAAAPLNPDADLAVSPTEAGTDAEAARREVYCLLERLPRNQRLAVELVHLAGLSHQEAAEALGVPAGTLSSLVSRGLARLRAIGGGLAAAGGLALWGAATDPPAGAVPPALIGRTIVRLAAPIQRSAAGMADGWPSPAVVGGLAGISGAVLIALAIGTTSPDPPAPPPAAAAADRPGPPAQPESVGQRTARVFHAEVEPIQVDALRRVFRGDGPITLDSLDVAGTWIIAVYRQPVKEPPGRTATVELVHETESRENGIYVDLDGSGRRKPVDPAKMVVLYRDSRTGRDVTIQHPSMVRALTSFESIPRDERSATEAVE